MAVQSGDTQQGVQLYKAILKQSPDDKMAINLLAILYAKQKQWHKALPLMEKAHQLEPNNAHVCSNLGNLLRQLGEISKAEKYLLAAYQLAPGNESVLLNLALFYLQQEQCGLAKHYYQLGLQQYPQQAVMLNNLGKAHMGLLEWREAKRCFEQYCTSNPDDPDGYYNLGVILAEQLHFDAAKRAYQKAIQRDGEHILSHMNITYDLLKTRQFKTGWQQYNQWRFRQDTSKLAAQLQAKLSMPLWQGEAARETVLLWTEQGIGDEILFMSVLPSLPQQNHYVVLCHDRMKPIYQRSFPHCDFLTIQPEVTQTLQTIKNITLHKHCPLGHLPGIFRNTMSSFPKHQRYLCADFQQTEKLRSRYKKKQQLIVGISWKGGVKTTHQQQRSIPLAWWRPILQQTDCHFVSVQYGEVQVELAGLADDLQVTRDDDIDPLQNMDAFSAQLSACDLIITVDNSTAHLAGALGKKTWLLLHHNPDWRWGLFKKNNLWYPYVELFRQSQPQQWQAVIAQVAKKLQQEVTCHNKLSFVV